jgi:predicted Zn finger-like uncharacterized protein
MATIVACPSCQVRLKVPDDLVGQNRVVKCAGCGEQINLADVAEGVAARPLPARAEEGERLEEVAEQSRGRSKDEDRKTRPRAEDDDEEDDRPRPRRRIERDDDNEEEDDRAPRRQRRRPKKAKSGSGVGLVIGLVVGVVLLLVVGCGVGAYFVFSLAGRDGGAAAFVDNPAVNQANFERVQLDMALPAVEDIFGRGARADGGDVKALLAAGGPNQQQLEAVADNPQQFGITNWYRWKNGPSTMVIAVDGARKVRVAGLVSITGNGRSTSWKFNVGAPVRPRGRK